jgi:cytochrome c oxidase subunit 2
MASILSSPILPLAFSIVPKSAGSPNANSEQSIYIFTLVFAFIIFFGVEGLLGYTLWRYRARKGAVADQIHGNPRLEIGWTLGAIGLLVILAVFTFIKLGSVVNPPRSGAEAEQLTASASTGAGTGTLYASLERPTPPPGKSLEINVVGRQYIWQFVYPGAIGSEKFAPTYSYEKLVVPTETTVILNVVSADVVHSWWVPELGGKVQAVPGYHSYTWFKIPKPGVYHGQCANLCGRGHARMIATVEAMPVAQFDTWLANQQRNLQEADADAAAAREKLASHSGAESVEHP